jgi:acyl dehydratase
MTNPGPKEVRFPVEATHLLFFARAIGDPTADDTDYTQAIAPPTFTTAYHQFVVPFELRPQAGVPWFGSGRGDAGTDVSSFEAGLHAEQEFVYHRPVRAGRVLLATTVPGASWVKARRDSGHLAFSEEFTELRDETTGALVQTARSVVVIVRPGPAPDGAPTEPAPAARPAAPASEVDLPPVGAIRELVVFDGLPRTQLVMYSGASGDYNPLHTDEIFATRVAGYPSVFAHGMLTMGASGRVLTEWVDPRLLRSYRVQFRGQVWPGDTLTVTATIDSHHDGIAEVTLTTTTQDGRVVLSGSAVLGPPTDGDG